MTALGKLLIITEKPSVAADIAKVLGSFEKKSDHYESADFYLTWAVGHLMELLNPEEIDKKYKRWLLQDLPILPKQFEYKPKRGQKERLDTIKSIAKKPNVVGIINACDAGREGELIFREIYEYCTVNKPIKRLWLQSMTTDAIKKEFNSLKDGKLFDNLFDAARCRSECDWLIGINGTRAMTKRLSSRMQRGSSWSVGRVQTPTLALVVRREMEVLKHRSEKYWNLEGRFSTPTHEYSGQWYDPEFKKPSNIDGEDANSVREKEDRIFSAEKLNKLLKELDAEKNNTYAVETRKESKEIAPQLFDLTSLQREANSKFGMTASRTLQAAQRLYEKEKLITYPRTDSKYLPEDYVATVKEIVNKFTRKSEAFPGNISNAISYLQKNGMLNKDRIFNNKYISDHFAIIPTGEAPNGLSGDDERIFSLILKRFLAAFFPHAVWAKVERITTIGKNNFRTKMQDLQVPGWREVYGLDSVEEASLPKLTDAFTDKPVKVNAETFNSLENLTKPLPRFSEARMLSLMENCGKNLDDENMVDVLKEKGIGTPATRAEIIENLIGKEYIVRVGKALRPTVKGIRLVDIINRIPVDILASVELTGEMEYELRQIEKGEKNRTEYMVEMSDFTNQIVQKAQKFDYTSIYESELPLGDCPACKTGQIIENFWNYRCANKACEFVVWKEKNQRYLDRKLVTELLQAKKVGPLDFFNSSNIPFQAYINITEKGMYLADENGVLLETMPGTVAEILREEMIPMTFLGYPAKIIETENAYICEYIVGENKAEADPNAETKPKRKTKKTVKNDDNAPDTPPKKPKKVKLLKSRMPKILCQRPMSIDDFKNFIIQGETQPILDFKSKKNRPFGAQIKVKPTGDFEFKFVARKKTEKPATIVDENGEEVPAKPKRKYTSKAKIVKKSAEKPLLND